jgi:hypothetical protein
MVFANDIKKTILRIAHEKGAGNLFYPSEVAREIDPENWVKQLAQVELVAESLIQEGVLLAARTGEANEIAYTKSPLN